MQAFKVDVGSTARHWNIGTLEKRGFPLEYVITWSSGKPRSSNVLTKASVRGDWFRLAPCILRDSHQQECIAPITVRAPKPSPTIL